MTKRNLKQIPNDGDHRCFACSPKNASGLQMRVFTDDTSVFSDITVPDHLCGWGDLVHGGVISTILDEIMGWGAIYLLKKISLTQSITVDYLKSVRIGTPLKAIGRVREQRTKNEALMESFLYDKEEVLCAKATGVFALASGRVAKRLGVLDDDLLAAFMPLLERE